MSVSPTSRIGDDLEPIAQEAVLLAEQIWKTAREGSTDADRAIAQEFAVLAGDPHAKSLAIALVDQVLRIKDDARAAERFNALLGEVGMPEELPWSDRVLLRTGAVAARLFPRQVMPMIRGRIRSKTSGVIISSEPQNWESYLRSRCDAGLRINLNLLGEAVLGHGEARRRLQSYLERLERPDVDYVSVKLSSVYSHIRLTGYRQTLDEMKTRLRQLYRAAMAPAKESRAEPAFKFVNLDMEEYRDLHLTVDAFQSVLDEPEFQRLSAGIVLQAYLPDSFEVQQLLTTWAHTRRSDGGAPIKIRLVKGANLAMERVDAALHDWPQATYQTKVETDANYKRMLEFALREENARCVRLGLASHNVFDIALAMLIARQRGVTDHIDFEMLEGMANSQARVLRDKTGDLLVYAPVCSDKEFESAIAYLVRRFDENTQPGNFLRSSFGLDVGSDEWTAQSGAFIQACRLAGSPNLAASPLRTQNRNRESISPTAADEPFRNAANTDFSLVQNRDWLDRVLAAALDRTATTIPVHVGGEQSVTEVLCQGVDPSRPNETLYRYSVGTAEHVERAIETAGRAQPEWEQRGRQSRAAILRQFAAVAANERGMTIGILTADGSKAVAESDAEVSEAIDFAEYYARALDDRGWFDGTDSRPLGTVVVTPPWNFPYAIPAGGCLAALMAGNAVILKPAPETVLTAWHLARQLWNAGVPNTVLQFLPLEDGENGKSLVSDPRIDGVVLTGAYATAELFRSWRPDLRMFAETSGKNSLIISSAADLDLAVKDLVDGAFGHSGQKCSATSLGIIQRDVYESHQFRSQLKDAAESLRVAPAWDLSADVVPLIRQPGPELHRGLTRLEAGESWLLEPKADDENPGLWSPGIRLGVRPGSWFHRTECFGPVLGLIPVDSIDEAIRIQNDNPFGLTGGLHSLDDQEIQLWRESVQVGNAYVNRQTTGAIVRRQPFGGWKHSAVGPGAKAGGPNYVAAFRVWSTVDRPDQRRTLDGPLRDVVDRLSELLGSDSDRLMLAAAAESYWYWWAEEFSRQQDPSQIHGEDNPFRYRPLAFHCARVSESTLATRDLLQTVVACRIVGVPMEISCSGGLEWTDALDGPVSVEVNRESDEVFSDRMAGRPSGSIRIGDDISVVLRRALHATGHRIVAPPCLANGRIELQHYLREQSISQTTHRYGNVPIDA